MDATMHRVKRARFVTDPRYRHGENAWLSHKEPSTPNRSRSRGKCPVRSIHRRGPIDSAHKPVTNQMSHLRSEGCGVCPDIGLARLSYGRTRQLLDATTCGENPDAHR